MARMTRLKRLREEQGYSIRELADMAGVSPDTIYQVENGHRLPQPKNRRKIAEALGISPKEVLTYSLESMDEEEVAAAAG
jgi:transcriptional regulator with XRE-family HTH domain